MGQEIVLQTEWGARVDSVVDPQDYLSLLLPQVDDENHPMLAGIDPYGNTIFNTIQMRRFLLEWKDVTAKASTVEERELIARIEEFAIRCRDEVHLYLRFI